MAHAGAVPRHLDIAATAVEALAMEADAYAVIDCLRATTTIATLFEAGLRRLWVAASLDEARTRARTEDALLFGEVGGLPPIGFDYGNSPVEAASAPVRGRDAVLFTTNGTTALTSLASKGEVFAAAPANASALLNALCPFERVVFVCAGTAGGTRFALEDFAAACYLIQRGLELWPGAQLGDMAILAAESPDPLRLVPRSHHAGVLRSLGLGADVDFAALRDTSRSAPRVVVHGPGWACMESTSPEG